VAEQRPWHHLFGLSWSDFFRGTGVSVEPEKDLSHKQQLLDLVIVRPEGSPLLRQLPDGFEDLGTYNLVTFKSHQEALDGEALDEMVGYAGNFRKQVSPSMQELLPLSEFRRFAVCVRSPRKLAGETALEAVRTGVYRAHHFSGFITVVVVHELPREPHNAMLLLFSAKEDLVAYAAENYQPHSVETNTLLLQLVARYREERIPMPETLEEMTRRTIDEVLNQTPPEELLKRLSPEERLRGLSPEERLRGLSPEELEAFARRMREDAANPPRG
jgi:hypothetical protein